ncbi:DUF445 domain-containing protein [Geodermatophilus siccatus]|uniref:DUF445 domain-containing protein n=1 Tax=Geodermatophilus siccatus TaxID=1137991 RepID=UPI00158701F8|nr:DUF445 family protein [Geodermatophilus siccatus]
MATGLLLVATAVFAVCEVIGTQAGSWVGYVRATAQAAMVGALADWFAVTALFRHPLGLPIPHTPLVPRWKDRIGPFLGTHVRRHLLTREFVDTRFAEFDVPGWLGTSLSAPGRAERWGRGAAVAVASGMEVAEDRLARTITRRWETFQAAPLLATVLESLVEDERRRTLVSTALREAASLLIGNRDRLRALLARLSPWYVPRIVDSKVFAPVLHLEELLTRLGDEQSGDRARLDKGILALATRLRTDPDLIERVEGAKAELVGNEHLRTLARSLWRTVERQVTTSADDPRSEFEVRVAAAVPLLAERLATDPALRELVQQQSHRATGFVVERLGDVADLVGETIARWDTRESTRTLELRIGRHLQFLRVNGLVVGGLAGLVIHAITQVV